MVNDTQKITTIYASLTIYEIIFATPENIKKNGKLPSGETITQVINKYRNKNWLGVVTACVSLEITKNTSKEFIGKFFDQNQDWKICKGQFITTERHTHTARAFCEGKL